MQEHEVEDVKDATFFMANEVVNEYHSFPVVQRADYGADNMFIMLNEKWYSFRVNEIRDPILISQLEGLST